MKIKKLCVNDSLRIAEIHLKSFEGFFLTSLGKSFLNKFYFSIIKNNQSIVIGIFEDNEIIGFAVGAKVKKGFYKSLLREDYISLLLSASNRLFKSPYKIIKLLRSFFSTETINKEYLNYASLLSICVIPEKKGQKLGKLLLEAFELEASKYNNGISLTTDKYYNDHVNNFYLSNNYILDSEFSQGSRVMNFYIKKLN